MCIVCLFVLYDFYLHIKSKDSKTPAKIRFQDHELPEITVQLPLYNEGDLLSRLLPLIVDQSYPKEKLQIQVLDDSDDGSQISNKSLCLSSTKNTKVEIEYIRRSDRSGYKAGALRNGLESASGKYIAILDADFMPEDNFLSEMISYFTEDNIACVQARWGFIEDIVDSSSLQSAQRLLLDNHFGTEQQGRYQADLYLTFNGTAGLWRKSAIIDSGNWHGDTIAEDLDLSLRTQKNGWKVKYINDYSVTSLLPDNYESFAKQQFRWCKGAAQVAVKNLKHKEYTAKVGFSIKLGVIKMLWGGAVYPVTLALIVLFPIVIFASHNNIESLAGEYIDALLIFFGATVASAYIFLSKAKGAKPFLDYLHLVSLFFGMSVQNTLGFTEAMIGMKSPFVRTLKSKYKNQSFVYSKRENLIHLLEISILAYITVWSVILVSVDIFTPLIYMAFISFGLYRLCERWMALRINTFTTNIIRLLKSILQKSKIIMHTALKARFRLWHK
jgi:cellulose synthase/poly-beta-1,6-N-acetylglucosamine synthase-like glycosyltransferase